MLFAPKINTLLFLNQPHFFIHFQKINLEGAKVRRFGKKILLLREEFVNPGGFNKRRRMDILFQNLIICFP